MSNENDEQNRAEVAATSPTADDYVRATALAVGVDPDEAVAYRRATDRTQPAQPTGYELGNAVAKVVAEHMEMEPYKITELHMTGDSIVVCYAVRTGPSLAEIQIRTRRIDPETGDTISDMPGSF